MEPKIEDYISDILEEDDIHIQKLNAIVAEAKDTCPISKLYKTNITHEASLS